MKRGSTGTSEISTISGEKVRAFTPKPLPPAPPLILQGSIQKKLLSRGRSSSKDPGEFRYSQNWVGGSRPGTALFVPPPHTAVKDCISDLERFLHGTEDGLPAVVKAGPN